jgi:ABC-type Fe3+/spermidine/putrescine transport system ATPase subunit
LTVTSEERETLIRWTRRSTTAQALARRAHVVLACADGHPNRAVARKVGGTAQTVGKWRGRFLAHRLDGLLDEPLSNLDARLREAMRVELSDL